VSYVFKYISNFLVLTLCAGAVLQFRVFGGVLGLAVASAVWNNCTAKQLQHLLPQDQLSLVLKSNEAISLLPELVRKRIVEILINSYDQRMKALIGFTAAQFIAVGMLWKTPQISLPRNDSTPNSPDMEEGGSNEDQSTHENLVI
jgi:hypothetical protein